MVGEDQTELCKRFEINLPGTDPRIVLVTSRTIPDTDGGTAGWVGTLADVTAEAWAEAAMAVAPETRPPRRRDSSRTSWPT